MQTEQDVLMYLGICVRVEVCGCVCVYACVSVYSNNEKKNMEEVYGIIWWDKKERGSVMWLY